MPFRPKWRLARREQRRPPARSPAARRRRRPCARTSHRYAARIARPSSSAAMLDCEKLVTSPARSQASTPAPIRTSRRRAGPQHDRRDGDHHQHREAPVDVRVEEQRVDPEVVVELVGGDHLRVQEEGLSVVLDEPDSGEQRPPGRRPPRDTEEQRARPAHAAQQQEQQPEGQVEEGEVLRGLRVIGRVARLQRVQNDGPSSRHSSARGDARARASARTAGAEHRGDLPVPRATAARP